MFIRIKDSDGDVRLVNADKIIEVYGRNKTESYIKMENDVDSFCSVDSVADIDQKLYRAGLVNN